MQTVSIKAEPRTDIGGNAAKSLRRAGLIPCELYGVGNNVHFAVKPADVKSIVYTADFKLAEVQIDGKKYRSIMKSIQFHPVTDEILHIDFLELKEGRKVKVQVPVQFEGQSPGVKNGGTLTQKLHRVDIKTTPENLIDTIVMDISKLKLGQSLRIRDIIVPEEVEILNNPSIPVASVAIPRALKSIGSGAELEDEEGEEGEESEEASEEATAETAE